MEPEPETGALAVWLRTVDGDGPHAATATMTPIDQAMNCPRLAVKRRERRTGSCRLDRMCMWFLHTGATAC